MAGQLKRDNPHIHENLTLIRALRDSNLPKFLANDAILFQVSSDAKKEVPCRCINLLVVAGSHLASYQLLYVPTWCGLRGHGQRLGRIQNPFRRAVVDFGCYMYVPTLAWVWPISALHTSTSGWLLHSFMIAREQSSHRGILSFPWATSSMDMAEMGRKCMTS